MIYTSMFLQQITGANTLIFVGIVLVFVVFMIWPNIKKQRKEKSFQTEMKRGDFVVTIGGIHGRVLDLKDNTCVLETMAGKMKFSRSAISMEASSVYTKNKHNKS